jgi:hypothetical protein
MTVLRFSKTPRIAGAALLASFLGAGIAARQQPQPQPSPHYDLNGTWATDDGKAVVMRHDGNTVSARFETPQPCERGGQRAHLLVGARYSGNELSGDTEYIACAFAEEKYLRACNLASVYATKFKATVSEDGSTITGEWLADGNWFTLVDGEPVGCRPDSDYDKWTTFTLTRCGSQDLKLTSADDYRINTDPKMPELKGESVPPQGKAQWEAQIKFKSDGGRSCSGGPDFDSSTMNERIETFEPVFSGFYGGELTVKVTTACGTVTKTEKVKGTNPTRAEINAEIGTVGAPFEADDLKRIACHESPVGQFDGSGNPVIAGGGDVGIMQICYQRQTRDIWDWKHNVQRGRDNLQEQVRFARQMPGFVRVGKRDRDANRIVYPRNALQGYAEATDFTDEQLRMEAIKRYNAGTELNVGYWEWDPAANQWIANPLGGGGGPGYADEVIAESTACGS